MTTDLPEYLKELVELEKRTEISDETIDEWNHLAAKMYGTKEEVFGRPIRELIQALRKERAWSKVAREALKEIGYWENGDTIKSPEGSMARAALFKRKKIFNEQD